MRNKTKESDFIKVVLQLMVKHKLAKIDFMATNYGLEVFRVLPYSKSIMDFKAYVWRYKDFATELETQLPILFNDQIVTIFVEFIEVDKIYLKIHYQNKYMFSEEFRFTNDEFGLRFFNVNYPTRLS